MQIDPSRARSIADAIDAYDAEIATLQEGKRDTFADLRTELESNSLDRATVRAEIASLKAAIAIRAKRRKDDAAEEREALTDDYLTALTCAPRATHVREATEYPATSPQPGRDPQSGDHGSDPGGRQVGESPSCSVEGCEKPERTRGLCAAHYARLLRHGDPTGGGTAIGAALGFYREEVLGFVGDGCLIWPFSRGGNGYGQLTIDGETRTVSRLACEETYGQAPSPSHEAAHSCGGGHLGCVNPKHLRWATRSENQGDRVHHGTDSRGEKSATAKLSEGDVREIISSALPIAELSERFGVSQSQISRVRNGQQWAHVEPGSEETASGGERVAPLPETRPAVTRNPTAPIDLTIPAHLDRRQKPQAVA